MQDYLERELYDLIKKDESIFRLVQDYALDGLWMWNLEIQERKWANRAFWATLGYDNHTVSNSLSWYNYINLQDFKILKNYLNLDIKNHIQSGNQIIRYTHRLGHTISTNFKYKIVFNTAGVPIRLLGAHRNVTSLEETQQRLRNQVEMILKNLMYFFKNILLKKHHFMNVKYVCIIKMEIGFGFIIEVR